MPKRRAVGELEAECQSLFSKLASLQKEIKDKLLIRADGKHLKGNELVGWLGEIYGNEDYSIDRMWLLDWCQLMSAGRFKKHIVRGSQRSFVFAIDEGKDKAHVVYSKNR